MPKAKKASRNDQQKLMISINRFNDELTQKKLKDYSKMTPEEKTEAANVIVKRMIELNDKIEELFNHPSDISRKKTAKNILLNYPLIRKNDEKIMAVQVLHKIHQTPTPTASLQIKMLDDYVKDQFRTLAEQEKRKKTASDYAKKGLKTASFLTVPTLVAQGLYYTIKQGMKKMEEKPEKKHDSSPPKFRK